MIKDSFDLGRVKRYIEQEPNCNVIIISNNKRQSELYWNRIKSHLQTKKRAYIITNADTWDGYPFIDSLVLKVGKWWENRNATEVIKHSRLARLALPISYIPPYSKGGE